MALAITVNPFGITKTHNKIRMVGTIVASGSYSTGGDTLNFLTATYPNGQGPPPVTGLPLACEIYSAHPAASPQTGEFQYSFGVGTTNANGVMQVFTGAAAQSALAELNAGAYPSGVTSDTIKFEAIWDAF